MATPLLLPFAPWRLDAPRRRVIEDLLVIARSHDPTVVAAMIEMLEDLYASGRASRFVKKLRGYPLFELKTRA